jgi:hypothetical protein
MTFSRISPEMALERENTHFLVDHFFDRGVSIALGHEVNFCLFGFGDLKKSIEIINSGLYSPYLFKKWLLSIHTDSALEFWGDPYWFKYYEERISTIENLKQTLQNEPYKKDDKLANYCFGADINILQENLDYLNKAKEQSKELRTLINKEMDDLEGEFARLLKDHNDLQEKDRPKPTLTTIYSTDIDKLIDKLTVLHNKAKDNELIKADLDSWLYWFAGKQCKEQRQIQWCMKRNDLMYFVYKLCPDLESTVKKFPLINTVFASINERKFDSNDKPPTNGNKVTDLINTLL